MTFAEMVRAAMAAKGMNQRDVAERVGKTEVGLSQVMTRQRPLKAVLAVQLEHVLGVDALELLIAQANTDLAEVRAQLEPSGQTR
jgi:transcriptional regulator with XRE-family HTH domain